MAAAALLQGGPVVQRSNLPGHRSSLNPPVPGPALTSAAHTVPRPTLAPRTPTTSRARRCARVRLPRRPLPLRSPPALESLGPRLKGCFASASSDDRAPPVQIQEYDLCILGGGPVGVELAWLGSLLGKACCVVEPRGVLCAAPTGAISKALREAARELGAADGSVRVPWPPIHMYVQRTTERALELTEGLFMGTEEFCDPDKEMCGPAVIAGTGAFLDSSTVQVTPTNGAPPVRVSAPVCFIATGSKAARIPGLPWGEAAAEGWLFDSDTIGTHLGRVPERVVVQGGGVIAVEYAFILRRLGAHVTVVLREDRFLLGKQIDHSIQDAIAERMGALGIEYRFEDGDVAAAVPPEAGSTMGRVELANSGAVLQCDAFLSAVGRQGCAAALNLHAAGLAGCGRGGTVAVESGSMRCLTHAEVDSSGETECDGPLPGVYAAGDVAGRCCIAPGGLVSTGIAQAQLAVQHAFPDEWEAFAPDWPDRFSRFPPSAIWVDPTIAFVGRSQEEAEEEYGAAAVGTVTVEYNETLKGCVRPKEGFLKMIYRISDGRVLGVHIYGADASEMIHHASALVNNNGYDTVWEITCSIPPGVTYQEMFKIAAQRAALNIEKNVRLSMDQS